MNLVEEFFKNTTIPRNKETEELLKLLVEPDSLNRMAIASDMGLPAITPLVNEIETRFRDGEYFSISDKLCRQNLGRMVSWVMRKLGYLSCEDRKRIMTRVKAEFIKTGNVYEKSCSARVKIEVSLIER